MTIEDPYLKEILEKQEKGKLYSEIKGIYFFAKAKDILGNWHYLAADSEEAIEKYCKEYSPSVLSHKELAIDAWMNYVDTIQVWYHFKYKGSQKWTWENSRYGSEKVRLGGPSKKTALVEQAREIARKELDKHKGSS